MQPQTRHPTLHDAVVLATLCFGAAWLTRLFTIASTGMAPVWPASGIAVAVLMMRGARLWPSVWAGVALALVLSGVPLVEAIVFGAGRAIEALAAAELLRRQIGVPRRFHRVEDVLKFMLCSAACALFGACFAVAGRALAGAPMTGQMLAVWWSAWQAGICGVLAFAPLTLAFSGRSTVRWSASRKFELLCYVVLLVLVSSEIYGSAELLGLPSAHPFLVLTIVMWGAFRFGQRMVDATVALAVLVAAWNMAQGRGPFGFSPLHESQLLFLMFTAILAGTGLTVSAVVRERRDAIDELRERRDQLESRVRERTLELAHANRSLQTDIAARTLAEARLKESETRVRLMIDSVVDYAIMMLDPGGAVTSWNAGAQIITGYRAEDIIGRHFSCFYPQEEVERGRPAGQLAIAADEGRLSEEGWRVRKDGTRFWAGAVITAMRDDAGRLLGFAKVTRDLTERRRYESQLVEAKAIAEKANEAKSEFLARMSHELRTPLNSLLILARLLADNPAGNLTGKQVQYAETIYGAGSDLLVLIDDILDLARVESGAVNAVVIAPTSLAELTEFLESTFRQIAREKGLQFTVEVDGAVPAVIQTDARRVRQVLKNLLANAFKFTSRGGVSLRVFPVDEDICFAVRDTGIGIPEDKQRIVFEAFRQADDTTSRQYGGSGLGLAISREFTRLLGGSIRLSSRPGEGSTFTLKLPLQGPLEHTDEREESTGVSHS